MEYVHQLKYELTKPENSIYDFNPYGATAYDGAWTIALMLQEASRILETKIFSNNNTRRLEEFTYDDWEMKELFFDLLADVQFEGVSVSLIVILFLCFAHRQ